MFDHTLFQLNDHLERFDKLYGTYLDLKAYLLFRTYLPVLYFISLKLCDTYLMANSMDLLCILIYFQIENVCPTL